MPDYRRGMKAGALSVALITLAGLLVWALCFRATPEPVWTYHGTPPAASDTVAAAAWPDLHHDTQRLLACIQDAAGRPLVITSGYRPGDRGMHGQGRAADIRATIGSERAELGLAAVGCGANGIGVYTRHVHVDTRPGPAVWWGGVSR